MNKVWFFGYTQACWECSGGAVVFGPYETETLAAEALEIYLRKPKYSWDARLDWRVFSEEVHNTSEPILALEEIYEVERL